MSGLTFLCPVTGLFYRMDAGLSITGLSMIGLAMTIMSS